VRWETEVNSAAAHWSKVYGIAIDPGLVHAIIERESNHGQAPAYVANHGIVPEPGGHHSAGPMQVYDDTLKGMNPTLELRALADSPGLGIWYGTRELGRLLKLFPGDTARAVAAYNAGSGNTRRNGAGQFINQGYVDSVLSFWNRNKGAVASMLPALLLAAVALWFMSRASRRTA
jgi:hypothetical protein